MSSELYPTAGEQSSETPQSSEQELRERISYLERKLEEAEIANLCDSDMTYLLNKRGMKLAFDEIQAKMAEDDMVLLAFFDINHFAKINEKAGHLQADSILAQYALHLCKLVRSEGDAVARYGGDEFVIAANLNGAQSNDDFLRRISAPFEATYSTPTGYRNYTVTSSVGIVPITKESDYFESLQAADDAAIYIKHHNDRKGVGYKDTRHTSDIVVLDLERGTVTRSLDRRI